MSKNKIGTIISPAHATIIKYKNLSKQSAIRDDIEFETQQRVLTEEDDHCLSVTDKFNKDVLSAGTQRLKENLGTQAMKFDAFKAELKSSVQSPKVRFSNSKMLKEIETYKDKYDTMRLRNSTQIHRDILSSTNADSSDMPKINLGSSFFQQRRDMVSPKGSILRNYNIMGGSSNVNSEFQTPRLRT